jgi:hypothetical protein
MDGGKTWNNKTALHLNTIEFYPQCLTFAYQEQALQAINREFSEAQINIFETVHLPH